MLEERQTWWEAEFFTTCLRRAMADRIRYVRVYLYCQGVPNGTSTTLKVTTPAAFLAAIKGRKHNI
jgi:predicted alpha-1,6-mannanase (GH76 family)